MMKFEKNKIILIALILLFTGCYTIQSSVQESMDKPLICGKKNCTFCHTYINDRRHSNKLVYRVFQDEKKGNKGNKQEYCCSHISNDDLYQIKITPDPYAGCIYEFLITNKNIIFDYLLPFFQDSIKREILYSYSENRDTVFENLIEYDHKVIENDDVYYYPLRDTALRYAVLYSLHWDQFNEFVELLKKENHFKEDCLIDGSMISSIYIYIPLID